MRYGTRPGRKTPDPAWKNGQNLMVLDDTLLRAPYIIDVWTAGRRKKRMASERCAPNVNPLTDSLGRSLFRLKRLVQPVAKRALFWPGIGPVLLSMIKRSPMRNISVMWSVTYKCPCRCAHCGVNDVKDRSKVELSTDECYALLDDFAAHPFAISEIFLFGGEPLVRRDIIDIIKRSTSLKLRVVVDTNGWLVDEAMADRLAEAGLEEARVSLDSPRKEDHDRNRGLAGCYDQAIRAARLLHDRGVRADLSTFCTVDRMERGDIAAIKEIARENGLDGVRVLPIFKSGALADEDPLTPEDEQMVYSLLEPGFTYYELHVVDNPKSKFICSTMLKMLFAVSPYGDVQPCAFCPASFGNIREEPFNDILERMWANPIYDHDCHTCLMNQPATPEWLDSLSADGDVRKNPVLLRHSCRR